MIKNKKSIAIFMIYLVLTITIFSSKLNFVSAAEQVNVNQASGDASISVDILNVPGINNLNYPIMLTYSGGDGIPINSEPTWVGLGWNLDSDTISRDVIGVPDDLNGLISSEKNTIHLTNFEVVTDGRSWWEKWGEIILLSILAVIEIVISILTGGTTSPYLAATIDALGSTVLGTIVAISIVAAITLAINSVFSIIESLITTGKVSVDLTTTDVALAFVPGSMKALQDLGNVGAISATAFDLIKTASAISVGLAGIEGVQAALSLPGMIDIQSSSTSRLGDRYNKVFKRTGFLYEPFAGEQYSPDNPVIPLDSGQPDKYFASGKLNGELVLASKYDSKGDAPKSQHLCNPSETNNCVPNDINSRIPESYFQFFSKKLGGIETVKIEYKTNLGENCFTFLPRGLGMNPACSQKTFQGYIDQFIVTGSDGTRIVYGDPKVPGSIVREHSAGIYKRAHRDYPDKISADLWFGYFTYTHHPLNWKVISILGPDYSGPLYPLEDELNAKGSWIAFKYNYLYNAMNPSIACPYTEGIFEGETRDEWGDTLKFGKIIDKSYLSEVVTPTHVAKFYTIKREDGLESKPWGTIVTKYDIPGLQGDIQMSMWDWGMIQGNSCEMDQDAREHKLDNIILMKRDGTVVQKIYFNKDISENNQYSLKKKFSDKGDSKTDHGRYTLKTVTICGVKDGSEECPDPYEFKYYDYTS